MDAAIQAVLKAHSHNYVNIPPESLPKIYDLFVSHQLSHPGTGVEYLYFGTYYFLFKHDLDQAETYYLKAVELSHEYSWHNLAFIYSLQKKHELAVKFYELSWDQGMTESLSRLIELLMNIYPRSDKTKKYILQAHSSENADIVNKVSVYYLTIHVEADLAMEFLTKALALSTPDQAKFQANIWTNFGYYYQFIRPNPVLMKVHYQRALVQGHTTAKLNLAMYYWKTEPNSTLMKQYFREAYRKGQHHAKKFLEEYYSSGDHHAREVFDCGIEIESAKLIQSSYQSAWVAQLIRVPDDCLTPALVGAKQDYIKKLFLTWLSTPTWFIYPYCVSDIIGLVRNYL